MKRVLAMNEKGEKKVLKTWSRSSTIFPDFVGHTFAVHDTSSASLHRLEPLRVIRAARRLPRSEEGKYGS